MANVHRATSQDTLARLLAFLRLRVAVRASSATRPGLVHWGPLMLSQALPSDRPLLALGFLDLPPFELSCAQDRADAHRGLLATADYPWRSGQAPCTCVEST